ncbi:MFS transporter [Nocardia sp. NPDC003963]
MASERSLGREFGWLWIAYAVSRFGTALAFNAFGLVAILALEAGPAEVSLLSAAGLAVGALVAIPLGPWVEFRRKRPVLIAMDLIRFVALLSVPVAHAFGALGFVQLLAVAIIAATADIGFTAASGAYLKTLVPPRDLLVANARFESTNWTAIVLGPPLGGAAVGLFGPMITLLADALSYLTSAAALRAIDDREPHPLRSGSPRPGERLEGWRYLLGHPGLRSLLVNDALVGALIMATQPLMAVLMLAELGFAPWEFGLAFALPCLGGLIGARLAPGLVDTFGPGRILRVFGTLRVCWPIALGAVTAGAGGLALVLATQTAVIICMAVFNPVFATYRLEQLPADRATRALAAWSISKKVTIAIVTALWGLLAVCTGPRIAITVAGALLLITPALLPRLGQSARSGSRPGETEHSSSPR